MSLYIQIGAGVGDQDKSTNYEDGFTNFVKNKNINDKDKILVVEANPMNIEKLNESWKNFKNIKIFNLAIVHDNFEGDTIDLFYTSDDQPSYQATSHFKSHVQKHYPNSEIKKISIKSKKISNFLLEEAKDEIIEYFAIDVEGMDYDLIMSLDLGKLNIQNISIEFLHLDKLKRKKLINKLADSGYSFKGPGFDINGYDLMFQKKTNIFLKFKTKYFTPSIKKFIKHS